MKGKALFMAFLLGLAGCGEPDFPALKEFRNTMTHAHTRISARQAFAMPDLVEVCVIPDYASIADLFKPFGFRTQTGLNIEARLRDVPSIKDASVGLIAFGRKKQSYLVLDFLVDDSVKVLRSGSSSFCFDGPSAEFVMRPSGWWQLTGKEFPYRIPDARTEGLDRSSHP